MTVYCLLMKVRQKLFKLIFHKYVNEGKGTHIVARELYEEGIKPPKSSKAFWSSTMILNILRNEKYVGDLLQKKYVTKDYLDTFIKL